MSALVIATHNVAKALPRRVAAEVLSAVLEQGPDVVGLQEWYPRRRRLLPRKGALAWSTTRVGGCVVGVDRERFTGISSRAYRLSSAGRSDRKEGWLGFEPSRVAVVVRCQEKPHGRRFAFVAFHLVHGVQFAEEYRPDRPGLVSRHQGEVSRLSHLVRRLKDDGHLVVAMGDSNFSGLRLPGLTSAWTGRESASGTLGGRQVDDVHAPAAASSMTTLSTPSDHLALIARYDDPRAWR